MKRWRYENGKAKKHIEDRGGTCISSWEEYFTVHSKLNMICQDGHLVTTTLDALEHDKWCGTCSTHITECICIAIMNHLFGKPFVKVRPDWLKTDSGKNLELDGYNEELKVAIEVQGQQHYEMITFFFKTLADFKKRQRSDQFKREKCKEKDIFLIEVPYTVKRKDIYDHIVKICQDNKLEIDTETPFIIKNAYKLESKINKIIKLITDKGGKLITSKEEIDIYGKFLAECIDEHQFQTMYAYLLRGIWCPTCGTVVSDERKKSISEGMKKYLGTDEGKKMKADSHVKRSETMAEQRKELRKNITEKVCTKCTKTKDISEFGKKTDTKDGFQPYCRECIAIAKKKCRSKG